MNRLLLLLLTLSLFANAQATVPLLSDQNGQLNETSFVTALRRLSPQQLSQIQGDTSRLKDYLAARFFAQQVEQRGKEYALAETPQVQQEVDAARTRAIHQALIQRLQVEQPADDEIEALARAKYDANPGLFKIRRKANIANISIRKDPCNPEAARATASLVVQKLAEGESFGELAKTYSNAPNAAQGGLVNKWLLEPPDLDKADERTKRIFSLVKPGEITEPFEYGNAFHVILLLASTPSYQPKFEQIKPIIVKQIRAEYVARREEAFTQSLRPSDQAIPDYERARELIEQVKRETAVQP